MKFEGFYKETIDFFVELTYNNNKGWFHQNKERHIQYVKNPMISLSNEIFEGMKQIDKNFNGNPKIARVNRDIRFSKDKSPYKISSWFYLRADLSPGIKHSEPTFFFEITANSYIYGFGYSPIETKDLINVREKIITNKKKIEKHINWLENQTEFKFVGEKYKKNFKLECSDKLRDWVQRKEFVFMATCENDDIIFSNMLVDKILKSYSELYDLYKFFKLPLNPLG